MTPAEPVGLLAEPERLRVVAASVLGEDLGYADWDVEHLAQRLVRGGRLLSSPARDAKRRTDHATPCAAVSSTTSCRPAKAGSTGGRAAGSMSSTE
ncbi:hypothetical protein ACVGVM_23470 [Pseudonocardia bannensis]|uniref:Uncharacterized protein n=1 Tax=Pseudonocardia bannensis TaxID=630973 RepID=A0A848DLG0_9PSEU|nr:hypothetical protein [Pseudonocardia bannensis]